MVGQVVGDGFGPISMALFSGGRRGIRTPDFNRVKVATPVWASRDPHVRRRLLAPLATARNSGTPPSGGSSGGSFCLGGGSR